MATGGGPARGIPKPILQRRHLNPLTPHKPILDRRSLNLLTPHTTVSTTARHIAMVPRGVNRLAGMALGNEIIPSISPVPYWVKAGRIMTPSTVGFRSLQEVGLTTGKQPGSSISAARAGNIGPFFR